ncbi:histidinol-phosphatase [Egibacter rhizosphaerae]|uniref:Histidinol-phosphatase n=1 Tax=Egibacter rhizosphaerae TaxID=1670831 RepID=A0A411YKJ2_9ACTN|nr:inositol monophosphatase family protein [Egibacter rhizosphaerae]QBI21703.1 histidinol-phosphatase [Egibacter rhizosphaerae]
MDIAGLRGEALAMADAADEIARRYFGGPVAASAKPDGSPVTAADHEIETALREWIARSLPGHAILGEEEGGALEAGRPTWVIDPIDGTKNFLRGVPVFGTLIALVVHDEVVVAVASAPALDERWDAGTGLGTRRNGRPVRVSAIERLEDAHLQHGGLEFLRDDPVLWERLGELATDSWKTGGMGDFWMHMLVAGGMAEAAFEADLAIWDRAALVCLIEEAGGRATTWSGEGVLHGDGTILSSNGLIHDAVRTRLTTSTRSR